MQTPNNKVQTVRALRIINKPVFLPYLSIKRPHKLAERNLPKQKPAVIQAAALPALVLDSAAPKVTMMSGRKASIKEVETALKNRTKEQITILIMINLVSAGVLSAAEGLLIFILNVVDEFCIFLIIILNILRWFTNV